MLFLWLFLMVFLMVSLVAMFDFDLCRCSMQCNWKLSLGASETNDDVTERGGVVAGGNQWGQ